MKTICNISCIGICITLFGLLGCGNNPVTHNGGSSTETARISGTFYKTDGTFAKNITVYLRKQSTLADTSVGMLAKKAAFSADTVMTSDSGTFVLDSLDTGTYVVEGTDGNNNLVRIDSIKITATDSIRTLPPDTLKPAGAIKGIINLSEGGDPRKVFVLAFGVDRFARVNADGSFKFSGLAEGTYDLRLISSLDSYGVLDTLNIQVRSADTNDMDSIDLPFLGIPTPKNVGLGYDTMNQIVTLKWSKADTSLVSSYNVYRRNVDSNTVMTRINMSPVTDTVYHDSTGVQDKTYEYHVVAVDRNASEGTKSAGMTISFLAAYFVTDSIPGITINSLKAMDITTTGKLFCLNGNILNEYNTATKSLIGSWQLPDSISPVTYYNTYIACKNDSTIFVASDTFIAEYSISQHAKRIWYFNQNVGAYTQVIHDIVITDSLLYFVRDLSDLGPTSSSLICRINLNNNIIDTVMSTANAAFSSLNAYSISGLYAKGNMIEFAVMGSEEIYYVYKYNVLSHSFSHLISLPWYTNQGINFIISGDTTFITTTYTGTCRIFTNTLLGTFNMINNPAHYVIYNDQIYVSNLNNTIYVYKKR